MRIRMRCRVAFNPILLPHRALILVFFVVSLSNRLVGLEQDLQDIATKQGKNVNDLIDLVNENELILSQMKGNLRQTFVAAMAKVRKLHGASSR